MLKRKIYDTLLRWKARDDKLCLLIKGARQVGKRKYMNIKKCLFVFITLVVNRPVFYFPRIILIAPQNKNSIASCHRVLVLVEHTGFEPVIS